MVMLVLAAAGGALAWSGLPATGPLICPFRRMTGLPCISCGMTRAVCALARGDVEAAFSYHAASIPLALAGLAWLAFLFAELATGREYAGPIGQRWARVLLGGLALAFTGGWALNLARMFGYFGI